MDKLVRLLSTRTRPILKLLGASMALVVITILFVSFKAPRVSAGPESDRDQEEREARIGFEIAPVPLTLENKHRHLDRRLVDKRVWPAIDVNASGTRKEDLLMQPEELRRVYILRKVLSDMNPVEAMELLVNRMSRTKSNAEFLNSMNLS